MTIRVYPTQSDSTSDLEFEYLYAPLLGDFVDRDPATNTYGLVVTANGTNMVLGVGVGQATIRGRKFIVSAAETVTIPAASSFARIDLVVIERNNSKTPFAYLSTVQGTSANTVPPLTQIATGVWQEPICQVSIPAGATALAAANLTDIRRLRPGRVFASPTQPLAMLPGDLWAKTAQ